MARRSRVIQVRRLSLNQMLKVNYCRMKRTRVQTREGGLEVRELQHLLRGIGDRRKFRRGARLEEELYRTTKTMSMKK